MRKHALMTVQMGILLQALNPAVYAASPPLPAMAADLSQTSVFGISSGGFMAAQLATAYSASFLGVGIIAAGPYYCSDTDASLPFLQNAMTTWMAPASGFAAADAVVSWKYATRFGRSTTSRWAPLSHCRRPPYPSLTDSTLPTAP